MNLEQLEAQYKKLGEEINNLKNLPEEFYKIGDVFKIEGDYYKDYNVLTQTALHTYTLVGIRVGNRWLEPTYNTCPNDRIPKSFVEQLAGGQKVTKVTIKITEQPEADKDGWIEWNGGECPVNDDIRVEVGFRSGSTFNYSAKSLRWDHKNTDDDIIAYRVLK